MPPGQNQIKIVVYFCRVFLFLNNFTDHSNHVLNVPVRLMRDA